MVALVDNESNDGGDPIDEDHHHQVQDGELEEKDMVELVDQLTGKEGIG